MRLIKALGALALLCALLVGVPWLLLVWGDPLALLRVNWGTALSVPDDGTITLAVLAVVGWLAWGCLVLTTVGELITVLSRGSVTVRLPGTGWLRPAVAVLVAAALAPLIGAGGGLLAPAPADVPPAQAVLTPQAPAAPTAAIELAQGEAGPVHVVAPGDELWTVAEERLGSGERWRDIVAANPGMTADTRLLPGATLRLPDDALAVASAGPASTETVVVQSGDTLWSLADEHLGDPEQWPAIYDANRDQIADPDEIDVGWELVLPAAELCAEPLPPAPADTPTPAGPSETDPPEPEAEAPAEPTPQSPPPTLLEDPPPVPQEDPAPLPPLRPVPTSPAVVTPPAQSGVGGESPVALRPALDLDESPARTVLGPMGALLAAGVVAGVATRRRAQLLERAVGRRVIPVGRATGRFWTALGLHADDDTTLPAARPTSVVLGWRGEAQVTAELEALRCTVVSGAPELAAGAVGALLTSLLCAPWSSEVQLVAVDAEEDWALAVDDPRLTSPPSLEQALVDLQRQCAQRRIEMGSSSLAERRADPDRGDAWAPVVYVFCQPLRAAHLDRIRDCLALGDVGVSVVVTATSPPADLPHGHLTIASPRAATMDGSPAFQPQLVSGAARRAIVDLFAAASTDQTDPAPWWNDGELPSNVTPLRARPEPITEAAAMDASHSSPGGPAILLLGPVQMSGCRGDSPTRAAGQCMEYCAWLLEHPDATATEMAEELLVAESTRRSNMSRLRSWLGANDAGEPYLPDAYSGRIRLDDTVTSDWESFRMLLSAGANRASTPLLRQALDLVRGEPLAGYEFQWGWASDLRADMVSMVTDAAAVLIDRAIIDGDLAAARWAIDRGRLAATDSEILAAREIHLLALAGDRAAMNDAVRRVTRAARASGRDLQPETVRRIQVALNAEPLRASAEA